MPPEPAIALQPDAGDWGGWRAECGCGWVLYGPDVEAMSRRCELHTMTCRIHEDWLLAAVDDCPDIIGTYVPAPLMDLLHRLLEEHRARPILLRWFGELLGAEDVA